MLVLLQEALPPVLTIAERWQPPVQFFGTFGEPARGEIGDALTAYVTPVERETEVVGSPSKLSGGSM